LHQLEEEIRALSAEEKEALVRVLLDDLDEPADPAIDAAWLAEAQHRSLELDRGTVRGVPAVDVFRRLEASLRK
jgi:putative addiction module component (TIGR02574 family)